MRLTSTVLVCALVVGGPAWTRAQLPGIPTPAASSGTAAPAPPATPEAVAAAAVPERASTDESRLEASNRALRPSRELRAVEARLPAFLADMQRYAASTADAEQRLDRRDLQDRASQWRLYQDRIARWQAELRSRGVILEREETVLGEMRRTWEATRAALQNDEAAPTTARDRVAEVLAEITTTEGELRQSTERLVETQRQLDAASETVEAQIARYRAAQAEARDQLLAQTEPPLWEAFTGSSYEAGSVPPLRPTLRMDQAELQRFRGVYGRRLPLDVFLLLLVLGASVLLSRRAVARATNAGETPEALLQRPIEGSLLLALVASRFIYPRAPYAFLDITALLSLVPLARTLPALTPTPRLLPPLYAVLVLSGLHRILSLFDLGGPWQNLSLMAVGAMFLTDVIWALRREPRELPESAGRFQRIAPTLLRLLAACLGLALVAGVFGYASLLALLVEGPVSSVYWMLVILAVTRVIIVFIDALLSSHRLAKLASVRRHGATLRKQTVALVHLLGVVLWVIAILGSFQIHEPFAGALGRALRGEATLGSWRVSLGDLLAFGLAMYVTLKLARVTAVVLEEDVLPRMDLARGVPAAVSRLARYAIVAMGFIFAVGAAGVDMSSVALLASALSVGIGFGLQNLVNNFVSGLMLIFERPIRVGDVIEVTGLTGEVKQIGIRSSTIRTAQGAEVIVPNADLISQRVVNWTLADHLRRVEVPVGVAYGTDPERVITLLQEAAAGIPGVVALPEPTALFVAFGASSLDFELWFWVGRFESWPRLRSQVTLAVARKLQEAGIEIPFPQRDLHIRSVDEAAAKRLRTD